MPKNAWLGVLVAVGLILTAVFAVRARRQEQADELTERALRLLHPPLSEAGSLRDIRGREARELLEEAQALATTDERTDLLALARASELYTRGRYAEAERVLGTRSLGRSEATQLMAAIKLMRGQTLEAQQLLEKSWSSDANDARAAVLRSDVARALGRADVALAGLEPFFKTGDASAA
jgi:thioredoxin-like negative regulator of GroEL